jgi:hypothetical protein
VTLTHYAEHVATVSHDLVKLFLENERLTARQVWQQVKDEIVPSPEGYIVFDDTVLDKAIRRKSTRYADSTAVMCMGLFVVLAF